MSQHDALDFNTKLARRFQRLKRDVGATGVRQNYRGTGSSNKHRRQLYVSFPGGSIDLWLEARSVSVGGCITPIRPVPRVSTTGRTIDEVYEDVRALLAAWLEKPTAPPALDPATQVLQDILGPSWVVSKP